MTDKTFPESARVVVIGGGIIGCSVAYHLADMGCTDVVLLERDQLTSGTTWHAAGLMTTYGSTTETALGIRRYSRELYARLREETGQETGFAPVGFIEIASDAAWKSSAGWPPSIACTATTWLNFHRPRSRTCSRSPMWKYQCDIRHLIRSRTSG